MDNNASTVFETAYAENIQLAASYLGSLVEDTTYNIYTSVFGLTGDVPDVYAPWVGASLDQAVNDGSLFVHTVVRDGDSTLGRNVYYNNIGSYLVQTSASPVPVPAAAWLFSSGLLGLGGFARRKKA